jgi:asparagine synthase (glutamine-hydrolysing)
LRPSRGACAAWMPRGLQVAAATLATWPLRYVAPVRRCHLRLVGTSSPRWSVRARICQLAYALFLPGFQHELLATDFAEALADGLPPAMRQRLVAETGGRTRLSAISVMEQRLFLGERLLSDNDG